MFQIGEGAISRAFFATAFAALLAASWIVTRDASAAEIGFVTANGIDVRKEPNDKASAVMKAYVGQMIRVDDFKDGWVHINFSTKRGQDEIPIEGWIPKKFVRARSRYGFWFERDGSAPPPNDTGGGGTTVAANGGDTGGGDEWGANDDWSDDGGDEFASAGDGFGDEGFGDDSSGGDAWGDSGGGDDWADSGDTSGDTSGGDAWADSGSSGGGDAWGDTSGGGDSGGGDAWGDTSGGGDDGWGDTSGGGGDDGWGDTSGGATAGNGNTDTGNTGNTGNNGFGGGNSTTIRQPRDSGLSTGLVADAGLGVTMNRYTLTSGAFSQDTGFATPYVGVEGNVAYYFMDYVGAGVSFGTGIGSLSAEFGDPINKSVKRIKTNVNKFAGDVLVRYPLGSLQVNGNVGLHMVDLQVNPILASDGTLLFLNSNRYLGGVLGAGLSYALMDNRLMVGAGGEFWLAPGLKEKREAATGTDNKTSGIGFGAHANYKVNDQLGGGVSVLYQGFKSKWTGDGNRFNEAITNAQSSDTFITIAITGAYVF